MSSLLRMRSVFSSMFVVFAGVAIFRSCNRHETIDGDSTESLRWEVRPADKLELWGSDENTDTESIDDVEVAKDTGDFMDSEVQQFEDGFEDATQIGFTALPEGPPVELYDCTAQWDDSIGRLSPVPLSCVLDPNCHESMVVAHRGAGGPPTTIAPENSMAALRAAVLMGVDGVEVDVRSTKDGELVLMHDPDLKRTCGIDAKVADLTLEEITSIHLLQPPDMEGDFSCETVPSFKQALQFCKGRLFLDVDTKTDDVEAVVHAIEETGMIDQAFIFVSSVDKALKARQVNPAVRVWVRFETPEEMSSSLELFDRPPEVFEVPWKVSSAASQIAHQVGSKLACDAFGQDFLALLLRDLSVYQQLYNQGADMLQTDYPALILLLLDRWAW